MADINKILKRPCYNGSSKNGSQMGRKNQTEGQPEKLHIQKVSPYSGDYDAGGAYWGFGNELNTLYCAFSPDAGCV